MFSTKLHVDLAWMNRVASGLDRFKKVKRDVYNCRCPVCGDSKTHKRIARFYFYVKKGKLNVYCHNCSLSSSFFVFIKRHYPNHFDEYKKETMLDSFKSSGERYGNVSSSTVSLPLDNVENLPELISDALSFETVLSEAVCSIDLPDTHVAKKYLLSRAFQENELSKLYYTDDFKSVALKINEEASSKLKDNEPRIVIPFINEFCKVEMIQGRSLDPKSRMKYLSIKAHDEIDKVFGLYDVDRSKTVYCVEGPFDSLFVDNCLATCDANLTRCEADTYIWDVQPRNKEVIRYMESAIESNHKIVIWPFAPKEKMDINDLIKRGVSRKELMNVIRNRTYSGLMAKMKFMEWKKL